MWNEKRYFFHFFFWFQLVAKRMQELPEISAETDRRKFNEEFAVMNLLRGGRFFR